MRKIYFIGNVKAEFASRWKREFSPESVAEGKAIAKRTAINKKSVSKGIYPMSQGYKDLEQGINKGQKLAAKGKQAMLTKAASPNRTMKPTTQRGLLKTKAAKNQLSSKSAQSFKQGAQNQATNTKNTRLRNAANTFKSNVKLRSDLDDALNPSKPFNPNESSWAKNATKGTKMKPADVTGKLNSIPVKESGLLSKIGGAIKRNPVASGAAIGAGVGALGYGTYKKMKNKSRK